MLQLFSWLVLPLKLNLLYVESKDLIIMMLLEVEGEVGRCVCCNGYDKLLLKLRDIILDDALQLDRICQN